MRSMLRRLTIAGGIGAVLAVVLLALAAGLGSWALALVGGSLGALLVIGGTVVLLKAADRFEKTMDQSSTRVRNLESRTDSLGDQAEQLESGLSAATNSLDSANLRLDEQDRVLAGEVKARGELDEGVADLRSSAASVASEVRSRIGAAESGLAGLEKRLEGDRAALEHGLEALDAKLGEDHARLESLGKQISRGQKNRDRNDELLGAVRRDVRTLRARVPSGFLEPVESGLEEASAASRTAMRNSFESSIQLGRKPSSLLSSDQASRLFDEYLDRDDLLQLSPLIEDFDLLKKQNLATLRRLYRYYRSAGYWGLASTVMDTLYEKSQRENDAYAAAKIRHEIELFSYPNLVTAELPDGSGHDPQGPILHMVGRVLPETQTGYTLRTQYTALAQARRGLRVAIVGQAGITSHAVEQIEHYKYQEVDYYLLPGPARNQILIDDWLRLNMSALADLVMRVRPSILHAQSDFFNALIVNAVGKKYGIPTVYESRGFWEESWLSRAITANGWDSEAESIFERYGLPEAYSLRKHAEELARLQPDHVFTLAEVMRDHILDSADGALDAEDVSIVPNAVESSSFPIQEADRQLAAEIGLPEGAVVVGYISSIVEYEGIDTLIDAYHMAAAKSEVPLCLLLVGDGDYLEVLRQHVERRGVENVFFTGRVPHKDILRYYGLIDLFVVPRKKSRVADLVTPLKPFEAFSTGRCVILSDVAALREIAGQSGAVETFKAGDPVDLSSRLLEFINNPARRLELGEQAARWVRNHRSWDRNVNEYYRAYRKLGLVALEDLLLDSKLALEQRGMNSGELQSALASAQIPPLKGWFTIQEVAQNAESILETGWRFESFDPVPVAAIEDWAYYGNEDRSWGFHLHAWEFMDPLLRAYDETHDEKWMLRAVRIAVSWIRRHKDADEENDPMAWYDMSQALRMPRLIAITLRASRIAALGDETLILAEAIAWHLDELHKERAYNPNNNHGFYTAVSQVHAAKYAWMFPASEATGSEGRARLARMAESQFAKDGVHLEHSPDYHRMLLSSFELAVKDGLLEDDEVRSRVERAAHVLGWMVQPDGTLVQFGDSPETHVVKPGAASIDPQTQYVLSDGERGQRPSRELAVYPEGGYAFVRSPQPDGPGTLANSGYLAFSAAYHSRAHKHADDLNFVWYDKGRQILTDAGRYGYGDLLPPDSPLRLEGFYYSAPERQYVEGTMAHNTLMMDGRDQERRGRNPYGSALGECSATKDGRFDLSARAQHADYIHRRRLVYTPGRQVLVKDSVFSRTEETREGIIWFNVSGEFELESVEGDVVFSATEQGATTRLVISNPGRLIDPVRGQADPLRGWRSRHDRSMEPTWSVGFAFEVDVRAGIDTLLRLE